MKKLTTLFLALLLLLSMAGCGVQNAQLPETTQVATQIVAQTTAPETTVPDTTEAEVTEPPTEAPTERPTEKPTEAPTERPTAAPTEAPTQAPTEKPTEAPTEVPTEAPTEKPTEAPTQAPTEKPTEPPTEKPTEAPATGLTYKDEVAAYIHTYHRLPANFITKNEAKNRFGSTAPKVLSKKGYCIGGDRFYNNEGLLPSGQTYYECDIGTLYSTSGSRGSKRLVYTKSGIVYYTSDHYGSFTRLY